MSKLTHNTLWARATTSASAPSRATSLLSKSHQHYYATSSPQSRSLISSSSSLSSSSSNSNLNLAQQDVLASVPGAVGGPYFGPQPAAFAEILDQHAHVDQESTSYASTATLASSFQNTFMLSAPMLRNMASSSNANHSAPRPQRSHHVWSHSSNNAETSLSGRLSSNSTAERRRLLFDGNNRHNNNQIKSNSESPNDAIEAADGLVTAMMAALPEANKSESMAWLSDMTSSSWPSSYFSSNTTYSGNSVPPFLEEANTSSSQNSSRTSSPKQQSFSHGNVDRDSVHFGKVSEPPAKFATTTSAQPSISTTPSNGNSGTSISQVIPSSSSASTSSAAFASSFSASSSSPSKPHTGLNDHWAKQFNIPRSTKRNDFMFEHGAYGIPKRHPLSSIRSNTASSNGKGKAKEKEQMTRTSPDPETVPTLSKVQQAAGMLAAAADFLTGPQTSAAAAAAGKGEHRPMKGEEALSLSFGGGSTAEGLEVRDYSPYGKRISSMSSSQQQSSSSVQASTSKVVIRGEDGRIIKDRLRSVQVGEDAYFLRPDSLGVADGVGGWTSKPGADPALFSRLLMHFCAVELSRYDNLSASDLASDNGSLLKAWAAVDPVEVMHRAWERCVRASRREGILGSSTALLALLRGDELRIANVGDCVLMIIRGGEMLFRSTEQQHSFNFPVQLGMMGDTAESIKKRTEAASKARAVGEGEVRSEHMENYDDVEDYPGKASLSASSSFSSSSTADSSKTFEETIDGQNQTISNVEDDEEGPEWDEPRRDAGRWSIRVQADDIIVVGSDGLMDNLFDEDIIEEVVRFLPINGGQGKSVDVLNFSPQLVSEALCSRAKAISEDSRAISSPFQQRAMEEGLNYVGGKHDDISVLVCLVGEREATDSNPTANEASQKESTIKDKCFIH